MLEELVLMADDESMRLEVKECRTLLCWYLDAIRQATADQEQLGGLIRGYFLYLIESIGGLKERLGSDKLGNIISKHPVADDSDSHSQTRSSRGPYMNFAKMELYVDHLKGEVRKEQQQGLDCNSWDFQEKLHCVLIAMLVLVSSYLHGIKQCGAGINEADAPPLAKLASSGEDDTDSLIHPLKELLFSGDSSVDSDKKMEAHSGAAPDPSSGNSVCSKKKIQRLPWRNGPAMLPIWMSMKKSGGASST